MYVSEVCLFSMNSCRLVNFNFFFPFIRFYAYMRLGRPAVGKRVLHVTCHSLMNWLKIYICIFIRVFDVIFLGNDQFAKLTKVRNSKISFHQCGSPLSSNILSFFFSRTLTKWAKPDA